jgi:hypothetical protein
LLSRTVQGYYEVSSRREAEAAPCSALALPQFTASAAVTAVTSAYGEEIEHQSPTPRVSSCMLWQLGVADTTCGMIGVIITS